MDIKCKCAQCLLIIADVRAISNVVALYRMLSTRHSRNSYQRCRANVARDDRTRTVPLRVKIFGRPPPVEIYKNTIKNLFFLREFPPQLA